jgi:two-component system, chemotaxis family, chemotaxis protein CheY
MPAYDNDFLPIEVMRIMKILIVDDSSAMRLIVKKTLRLAGFDGHEVTEAQDGAEALASIHKALPDLVLSDWNMPKMTGIELLEKLTSDGLKLKFGFVTTEATADMRTRATAAGARFLISKPFTPESFKDALTPHMA